MAARIRADFSQITGRAPRGIYGHFAEHLGGCVYGGMWVGDDAGMSATRGWRPDVIQLVRALRPPLIRWPGGCFSEQYHWEDGIGPRQQRPVRFDWMWKKPEPNAVGTHEFLDFCELVGAKAVIAVNVRTGTPEEAARWVQYCNDPPDSEQGQRRAGNGHPEPYEITYWDIGNESWQLGVDESARRFVDFAQAMRSTKANVKLVAVGGHPGNLDEWNEAMVKMAGSHMDSLAPHHYDGVDTHVADREGAYYANLASSLRLTDTAERTVSTLDRLLPKRPEVGISFDEWGIWVHSEQGMQHNYNLSDGLAAAGFFHGLHRIGRRLNMANWAQLVNCLGMIQADAHRAFATPVYHVFSLYGTLCGEEVCASEVLGPTVVAAGQQVGKEPRELPLLDASATRREGQNRFTLAAINRSFDRELQVDIELAGLSRDARTVVHHLTAPEALAHNSFESPQTVHVDQAEVGGVFESYTLPAHSVTLFEIREG